MRPLQKIVDLSALRHNVVMLQKMCPQSEMIGVVKADAYGHGVQNILPALEGLQQLAVASIDEALQLRQLGESRPIVLLEGVFAPEELALCVMGNFHPCIHNAEQLLWLQNAPATLKAWLKIDVGMHRLGFAALPADLPAVSWLGVLAHFPCADEEDATVTREQLARLQSLVLPAGWRRCFANSAATLRFADSHCDAVRVGLALYGLSPFAAPVDFLRPVMTLQTEVLALHALQSGECAGYGRHFCAPTAGNLATIALGYGDGFPRAIRSGAVHLRLGEKRYPLVGRVAMDMALLWLGEDKAQVGDKVVVFGAENPAETVAREANTIPYTLTTMLTARPRVKVIASDIARC